MKNEEMSTVVVMNLVSVFCVSALLTASHVGFFICGVLAALRLKIGVGFRIFGHKFQGFPTNNE